MTIRCFGEGTHPYRAVELTGYNYLVGVGPRPRLRIGLRLMTLTSGAGGSCSLAAARCIRDGSTMVVDSCR